MEYIRLVEAICRSGGGPLDLQDTAVSQESFEVALYAVGGVLKAVNLVMEHRFDNVFALVRPPGHHARRFQACGFCIFNNVAVTAEYLRRKFKLERILILDVDSHHGNGIQEKFYGTSNVLYISLHEDPHDFPGTGFVCEVGEENGIGYNVNIPLPFKTSDEVYLQAMREIVSPIILQYKPAFTLVSAGFDAHYSDPVGKLSLSASCYQKMFEMILQVTEACGGRLVSVLEGGYSLSYVGKLAATAVAEMSGTSYVVRDKAPPSRRSIELRGARVIDEVKKIQRAFWSIQ